MKFSQVLKKAMIDKKIDSATALSEATGVSVYITRRLLKDDNSCSLKDLKTTADHLDVSIVFSINRENNND